MSMLTRRDLAVLDAIKRLRERGEPRPSYREICDEAGLKSTSRMHVHLGRLAKAGYVAWTPTLSRTVRVIGSPPVYRCPHCNKTSYIEQ